MPSTRAPDKGKKRAMLSRMWSMRLSPIKESRFCVHWGSISRKLDAVVT